MEKTLEKNEIYHGKIINVRVDTALLPNGNQAKREVVEHPGGVCIAALTEGNELLFVRQFRYPYAEIVWELPAGKLEPGSDPLETENGSCERKPAPRALGMYRWANYTPPPATAGRLSTCIFAG